MKTWAIIFITTVSDTNGRIHNYHMKERKQQLTWMQCNVVMDCSNTESMNLLTVVSW